MNIMNFYTTYKKPCETALQIVWNMHYFHILWTWVSGRVPDTSSVALDQEGTAVIVSQGFQKCNKILSIWQLSLHTDFCQNIQLCPALWHEIWWLWSLKSPLHCISCPLGVKGVKTQDIGESVCVTSNLPASVPQAWASITCAAGCFCKVSFPPIGKSSYRMWKSNFPQQPAVSCLCFFLLD